MIGKKDWFFHFGVRSINYVGGFWVAFWVELLLFLVGLA